tara:strand:+ start:2361 stop:3974 length:1614 start_codon:yes stop_codon:yes gene_type:complete
VIPVVSSKKRRAFGELFSAPQAHYALRDRYDTNQTVIRVRRSSDNAETDVTSSQVGAWLVAWVGVGNDGFVVTWYDLTTNGNDATQATSTDQPKIVDSGALVTENGLPAVEFDDDFFEFDSLLPARSLFWVQLATEPAQNDTNAVLGSVDLGPGTADSYIFFPTPDLGAAYKISLDGAGGDTGSYWKNGQLIGSGANVGSSTMTMDERFSHSVILDSAPSTSYSFLGRFEASNVVRYAVGTMQEFIAYSTDQSANRAAINRQLGADYGLQVYSSFFNDLPQLPQAHYSLKSRYGNDQTVIRVRRSSDNAETDFKESELTDGTLTTWTGANDGFVVTWYDLTSNSNDATQATSTNQPKIVDSGALNTENGFPAVEFDGTDDILEFDSAITARSIFCIFSKIDGVGNNAASVGSSTWNGSGSSYVFFPTESHAGDYYVSLDGGGDATSTDSGSAWSNGTYLGNGGNIGAEPLADSTLLESSVIYDSGAPKYDFTQIGSNSVSSTTFSNFRLSEWLAYSTDQSANRAAIDAQLMADYSIS